MEALEIQAWAEDPQRCSTLVLIVEHGARKELLEKCYVFVGDVLVEVLMVERPSTLPKICNVT